ncbi:GlxA family transcriptional regulator [Paractinoplanes atraurantiacus]|uniref:Transcriptional regulator GlxA family, contains an amidase domain and an AraC-type DNA-binding HTH domain n=1 Tax=Paractinoplanes atraurantiacus TaxID=1036182 RepID=A0A285IKP4_9ACTN|nr:Transcriptional regulator GlxA family, contains an amidase domain and an AraC-type DNA-binding HTH domain [Actinoplanes atraurantiacus]
MHRVAVLALDGVYPFELGIPARILGAAGDYDVVTCSVGGRPVRTNADFDIAVNHDARVLRNAQTVIIPPIDPLRLTRALPGPVREAIASIPATARKVSLCTGAFVLAAASLLDGPSATTHWECAPVFRRWFPSVSLIPEVLFVDEGDVVTSAGAAAGVDLCLHVVRSDLGAAVANDVARRCVVPPRCDGGRPYADRPVAARSVTGPTREWAHARLDEPLRLPDLAEHAGVSLRGFVRHFRAEVGLSPGVWLG